MVHPKILEYCKEDVVDIRGFDRNELIELEEGKFVLRAYPGPDCGNNIGTIHGGFLLALVDLKPGKRMMVSEVEVIRPNGKLAVKATVTVALTSNLIIDL